MASYSSQASRGIRRAFQSRGLPSLGSASPACLRNVSPKLAAAGQSLPRSMATLANQLSEIVATFPHKDAVRYAKQCNMKW